MTLVKNIFKSFLVLVIFVSLVTVATYYFFLSKPENIISVANKIMKENYSIQYREIESDLNFLSPLIVLSDVIIIDQENNEIIKSDEIKIGLKIIKSILNGYIDLHTLSITNIEFLNGTNSTTSNGIYRINISNLHIHSNQFIFSARNTEIFSRDNNLSIFNKDGEINNIPFKELSVFNKAESSFYQYLAFFELDENVIEKEELINLNGFYDKKINLYLSSKGYFDSEQNKITSINKYIFNNSNLVTESNYEIQDVEAVLYTNIDQNLSGLFSAKIPDQSIEGSITYDDKLTLRSQVSFKLNELFNYGEYINLSGNEIFKAKLIIDKKASLELISNLSNTTIRSNINDLKKDPSEYLKTIIYISDLSEPTYAIENKEFKAFIDGNSNGYFSLGPSFDEDIEKLKIMDGFYIFLELNNFKIDNLVIDNQLEDNSNLKLIKLKINQLNFFNNLYRDQKFEIKFNKKEIKASFNGDNLNGTLRIDSTGFSRIDVFDTKFDFKGINIVEGNESLNFDDINLRFIGKNIQTFDDVFQNIDFYFLRNKTLTTIDNINISSESFNIGPSNDNVKAYISYNNKTDLYKVRGSYEINNEDNIFENFVNYDFEYLFSDLNIQWESITQLKNLEGRIKFKIKDLQSYTSMPDTALLSALKIFNLNALLNNLTNESTFNNSKLIISRAEGDFYVGQKRALFSKPIKLETPEAKMNWTGNIGKDKNGLLDQLDLDLDMRLKVSENIPWYAAIFGGIPALAGGFVFENIIDERLDDASTFKFKVTGSIDEPAIKRLD